MTVNYDRVCRLCLSSRGELLPIFPTTSPDESEPPVIASKIKDCVSVQINENDDLPTKVCNKCMNNVNNWHIFKSVCERSQNKLLSLKDSSQLEEVNIKSEPLSDEAYDDGVVIDGSYPEQHASNKIQPEGPPILASLGLTPRSDKGAESDKEDFPEEENEEEEEEEEEEDGAPVSQPTPKVPNMPEVSITVMRPTGETLQSRQGIQQIASKDCLICGRSYRYSHNARRHELGAHNFDRYTNKVIKKQNVNSNTNSMAMMPPKLRPNPFNPKARLMPNPISHKMQFMNMNINVNKPMQTRLSNKVTPPKPIPIRAPKPIQNNLPYPLRIKALKDLQIKKKEPQILKTLLTAKPEVLIAEPEILNSAPESPETLTSEPDIASFQVEAVLDEPEDGYDQQGDEEIDGEMHNSQGQLYDTVDGEMDSENEIEIARQQTNDEEADAEHEPEKIENHNDDNVDAAEDEQMEHNEENQDDVDDQHDFDDAGENHNENLTDEQDEEKLGSKEEKFNNEENYEEGEGHEDQETNNDDEDDLPLLEPQVEVNDAHEERNSVNDETVEGNDDEELDETGNGNDPLESAPEKELDDDKIYVTKSQRDFIVKYRDVIQQINTQTCLCCNKEYPRRKAVIQHLQKYGHKVPKHTCYNCVVTFSHIGALLSHMRANVCTDLWKIIYNEDGITDDMVIEDEPPVNKSQYKELLNARSYSCKLCPAKFQLKQFIQKHVLDVHEDGQSLVHMYCVHCKARFKDRGLWKRHIRNADCVIFISCDICSEKFGSMQDFNNHAMAVHAETFNPETSTKCVDVRPTDCPLCNKKNSTYQNLIKHMKAVHDESMPHYCQHCDAKFEQAADLNKHIYDAHSDKSGAETIEPDMSIVKEEAEEYHYSCTECDAIFETVDAWTDHQVAEHNQIAHHCDQCEKKFLRPSELAEHKNTHLRVKLYACSLCSNSYGSTQKLSEHVQKAHPNVSSYANAETEFFCDICVRSFKSRQAYSNHMRIHAKVPTTNRKPQVDKSFAPQVIGKPIKQIPFQSAYVAMKPNCIVPNAPYSCDICGKGFMHKKNIWKHKKVLHADIVNERNDSEENTMQGSTEEDEYNPDENMLSTPQFNSFNFSNVTNNTPPSPQQQEMYSCDLCYKKFPLRSSLWKHKRAKHGIINPSSTETQTSSGSVSNVGVNSGGGGGGGGGRASCTICKITFSDKKSYYRHRKNIHKTSVQMCKICGKPLSSTLELYEHLKAAHARELLGYNANQGSSKIPDTVQDEPEYDNEPDIDPNADYQARYPCDTCGKQFVGLLALQNHQCVNQVPSQPQSFDCEICHKSYSSISALKSHRGWHLRSPDGKAAANNSGLWMPQNKVTNKVSKHEIVDPSQLAKVTHSTPIPTTSKRRLPPEVEVTIVNPNKKLRSDDSEVDPLNAGQEDKYCNICDKEFTKRAAYYRHMDEVHQPNSVFCPVCNKSFTRKSTLLVHMKKHYDGEGSSSIKTEDDIHACDVCGAQYLNERALKEHRIRHHGEVEESEPEEDEDEGGSSLAGSAPPGEFTCGQCGQGVATPRDLILHRNIHSTPTKFFCIICKVYFSRAIDLSAHTRDRHSDNDKVYFPCAMCDRFYMNKKSLQRHIEMAH